VATIPNKSGCLVISHRGNGCRRRVSVAHLPRGGYRAGHLVAPTGDIRRSDWAALDCVREAPARIVAAGALTYSAWTAVDWTTRLQPAVPLVCRPSECPGL